MSKIKLTMLVLGGLLIGNANLYAAPIPEVDAPEVTASGDAVETEPAANTASTKEDETPITRSELQGVRSEIAVLSDQLTRQLTRTIANSNRALLISGTLQNRYSATTWQNTSPYNITPGFSFNSAILSLSGNLKKDYEEGKNIDYAVGLSAAGNVNPTKTTTGSTYTTSVAAATFQPTDAYIKYSILPSLSIDQPYLYIQLGQQKRPFGVEPQATEDKQPAINLATFSGPTGLNLSARDIGVQLKGDLFPIVDLGYNLRTPTIEYALGVFNGTGPNQLENNSGKDFAARVNFNAPVEYNSDFRGLTIGSSFSTGKQDLAVIGNPTQFISGGIGKASKVRYGGDISYVASPIGFTAEYVVGRDEQALSGSNSYATAVTTTTQSSGYTLTLFYEWGEQFQKDYRSQSRSDDWWPKTYQPFLRFDHWDPNTAVAGNDTTVLTAGFNFFFAQTTKLQLNYTVSDNKLTKVKENDFILQFQYGF